MTAGPLPFRLPVAIAHEWLHIDVAPIIQTLKMPGSRLSGSVHRQRAPSSEADEDWEDWLDDFQRRRVAAVAAAWISAALCVCVCV